MSLSLSCTAGGDDADLKPPLGYIAPAVHPLLRGPIYGRQGFGRGFWPMEFAAGKTWRWMADRGEIRLPKRPTRQSLRIVGWLPLEFLEGPPTIQITLDNHQLDRFVAADRVLDRDYRVNPAEWGDVSSAVLLIETSATARVSGDTRDLGVAIEAIKWEDLPP
jgi:hypothetical protein